MKKASFFVLPLALATAFTAASAFTLNGTVTDEAGTPVQGALVKLIAKGDSAQTDKDGKFVFKEDDVLGLARFRAGHIGIVDGVLRFSQSSNSPVLVSIFDMMGNLVLRQELHGSGQVDLRQGVTAQGSYFACSKLSFIFLFTSILVSKESSISTNRLCSAIVGNGKSNSTKSF